MGFIRNAAVVEPARQSCDTGAAAARTPVVICADDYAMTAGISEATRLLVAAGRVSAVSCVVVSRHWPAEAAPLRAVADDIQLGLHLSLTFGAPVRPMPTLAPSGQFPSPLRLAVQAFSGGIDIDEVAAELSAQIDRFADAMGRWPDFIDGHHHCHLFPGIREAVLRVLLEGRCGRDPWLRYLALSPADIAAHYRLAVPAAAWQALLGRAHYWQGVDAGIRGNQNFRGIRRFIGDPPYGRLFERFTRDVQPGTLIMCHPGLDDGERLPTRHPPAARTDEFAFLISEEARDMLDVRRLSVGPLPRTDSADATIATEGRLTPAAATLPR